MHEEETVRGRNKGQTQKEEKAKDGQTSPVANATVGGELEREGTRRAREGRDEGRDSEEEEVQHSPATAGARVRIQRRPLHVMPTSWSVRSVSKLLPVVYKYIMFTSTLNTLRRQCTPSRSYSQLTSLGKDKRQAWLPTQRVAWTCPLK